MSMAASKSFNSDSIIDTPSLERYLDGAPSVDEHQLTDILDKATALAGLSVEETATLLRVVEEEALERIFQAAENVKESIYGKRIVLFAPLYISNVCTNRCLYCAFSAENRTAKRRTLSLSEIADEVRALLKMGHKRVLLVSGESRSQGGFSYLCRALETIYQTGDTDHIRRVNVNVAPLTSAQYRELKKLGIGTYQSFQETYHRPTYERMHLAGPKSDYHLRLRTMHRAMSAGIDDVGIGALFGLFDHRFEVLALLQHAKSLDSEFGAGPHTISVPRLEPAVGSSVATSPPAPVSDREFMKIIAVLRLAVPYTGIILSTRERPALRNAALRLGVSQMSAGSCTEPGGYSGSVPSSGEAQFEIGDHRPLDAVIIDVLRQGFLPSFCTACYRRGRTGKDFMDLAKPGLIKCHCLPNGLLTLLEYLEDAGSEEALRIGRKLVLEQLPEIPGGKSRAETEARMERIVQGERDLYF